MKKFLLSMVAMVGALTMSAETLTTLWEGSQKLDFGTALPSIAADKCKNFKEGDQIRVTLACGSENDWGGQYTLVDASGAEWTTYACGTDMGVGIADTKSTVRLDAAGAAGMAAHGFAFTGQNITVTKVEHAADVNQNILWEGPQELIYDGSKSPQLPGSLFANVQAGHQIVCYINTLPNPKDNYYALNMACMWEAWKVNGFGVVNPTAGTKKVIIDIEEECVAQLRSKGVCFMGNGIELLKVEYLPEVRDKSILLNDAPFIADTESSYLTYTYNDLVKATAVVGSGVEVQYTTLEGTPVAGAGNNVKFMYSNDNYEWTEFSNLQVVSTEGKSILILNKETMDQIKGNSDKSSLIIQLGYANVSSVKVISALDIPGTAILLDETEANLTVGDTHKLTYQARPADIKPVWTSSDEKVATVDATGLVTAVGPGTATITATAGTASAVCTVTVKEQLALNVYWSTLSDKKSKPWGDVKDLTVSTDPQYGPRLMIKTLPAMQKVTVKTVFEPETNGVKLYEYKNGDSSNGTSYELEMSSSSKPGKVTITISMVDDPTITETFSLTVVEPEEPHMYFKYYSKSGLMNHDLMVGESFRLSTEIYDDPDETMSNWRKKYTSVWTSSDPSILFVSENGTLCALKTGKATISCTKTCDDDPTLKVSCSEEFTINEFGTAEVMFNFHVPDRGSSLDWRTQYNYEGERVTGEAITNFPMNANLSVFTVENDEIKESVIENAVTLIVENATYQNNIQFNEGSIMKIKSNDPDYSIETVAYGGVYSAWSENIALPVEGVTGNVWNCPDAAGTQEADLKITSAGGFKCSNYIWVRLKKFAPLRSITLNAAEYEEFEDTDYQLTATFNEGAKPVALTWTSSDEKVATVDANGLVKLVAPGTATITAAAGDIKAECKVTVKKTLPTQILLDKTEVEGFEDTTVQLTATAVPDKANPVTVTWTSSDEKVATVDANGLVSLVAPGTAAITATCEAGDLIFKAVCQVTVKKTLPEAITLDKTEIEATEGEKVQLTATVTPDKANPVTVLWTSSDEKVATVDATGLVSLLTVGEATITATIEGTDIKAECAVKSLSGISDIEAEGAEAVFYTIDGIRVDGATLAPGIYIKRQGNKVEKILVK